MTLSEVGVIVIEVSGNYQKHLQVLLFYLALYSVTDVIMITKLREHFDV